MNVNDITFNGVLVERVIDNGDGTGSRTTYDQDGNVVSVEDLADLPIPEIVVNPLHQLAAAIVAATTLDDLKPTALAILNDGDS